MTEENLESKVTNSRLGNFKRDSSNFIKADIIGEIGSVAGSYAGAIIGEKVFHGSSRLLNVLSGSIPGDYLMSALFSSAYWYSKNKEEYKGWDGKVKFAKDISNFIVRDTPAAIASYLVYAPIVAAGLGLGLAAGPAAAAASVLSSALYVGGSYLFNKGYLKKLGEKQADSNLSPASPQVPTPATKKNAA
jgi:hypothetical protein